MSLVQGAVGSSNYSASSRYFDGEGKLYLNKKRFDTPLITFLGLNGKTFDIQGSETGGLKVASIKGKALSKRQVANAKFMMFTDAQQEYQSQVNNGAGYASGATSIVVDDGSLYTANDMILCPRTGEQMAVSARSGNTLTVVRGVGSTAAALLDNDYLVNVSAAYPVNALSGTPKATVPAEAYNYTQIYRTPASIGHTDEMARLNYLSDNGYDKDRLVMEAGFRHLQNIERAFWYGKRAEVSAIDGSGTLQRTTGGVFQFVTSNVTDISGGGGTLTLPLFESFAEQAFSNGSSEKILFCSPRVLSKLNQLAAANIRITPVESRYGLNLTRWDTSHGTFWLVRTSHFGETGLGSEYAGYAVSIDAEQIKQAYLKESENEYRDNIQENDRDGYKGAWLAECGLQLTNETSHAILKGVAA